MDGKFNDIEHDVEAPRRSSPNLARAEASIKEEDRRATRMVSPARIKASAIQDRLEVDSDIQPLIDSMREHGQQVPVLLRRLHDGELEVVYGRRRIAACTALGIDVRAAIVELTDEEALISQGLENNARLDTSFIEKAIFLTRILHAGYDTQTVHQALGVSQSLLYKMRVIADSIPLALIEQIGAAHGAGRPQWMKLATYCQTASQHQIDQLEAAISKAKELPSLDRLAAALQFISSQKSARATSKPTKHELIPGRVSVNVSNGKLEVVTHDKTDHEFLEYLTSKLPQLMEDWEQT